MYKHTLQHQFAAQSKAFALETLDRIRYYEDHYDITVGEVEEIVRQNVLIYMGQCTQESLDEVTYWMVKAILQNERIQELDHETWQSFGLIEREWSEDVTCHMCKHSHGSRYHEVACVRVVN